MILWLLPRVAGVGFKLSASLFCIWGDWHLRCLSTTFPFLFGTLRGELLLLSIKNITKSQICKNSHDRKREEDSEEHLMFQCLPLVWQHINYLLGTRQGRYWSSSGHLSSSSFSSDEHKILTWQIAKRLGPQGGSLMVSWDPILCQCRNHATKPSIRWSDSRKRNEDK